MIFHPHKAALGCELYGQLQGTILFSFLMKMLYDKCFLCSNCNEVSKKPPSHSEKQLHNLPVYSQTLERTIHLLFTLMTLNIHLGEQDVTQLQSCQRQRDPEKEPEGWEVGRSLESIQSRPGRFQDSCDQPPCPFQTLLIDEDKLIYCAQLRPQTPSKSVSQVPATDQLELTYEIKPSRYPDIVSCPYFTNGELKPGKGKGLFQSRTDNQLQA